MVVVEEGRPVEDDGSLGDARLPGVRESGQLGMGRGTEWSPGNDCVPPPG